MTDKISRSDVSGREGLLTLSMRKRGRHAAPTNPTCANCKKDKKRCNGSWKKCSSFGALLPSGVEKEGPIKHAKTELQTAAEAFILQEPGKVEPRYVPKDQTPPSRQGAFPCHRKEKIVLASQQDQTTEKATKNAMPTTKRFSMALMFFAFTAMLVFVPTAVMHTNLADAFKIVVAQNNDFRKENAKLKGQVSWLELQVKSIKNKTKANSRALQTLKVQYRNITRARDEKAKKAQNVLGKGAGYNEFDWNDRQAKSRGEFGALLAATLICLHSQL